MALASATASPPTSSARISASAAGPAATTTSRVTAAAPSHSATLPVTVVAVIAARIREIDGVDHRVGTLRGLDRAIQVRLAAPVDAIRENDESFPPRLLFH